MATYYSNKRGGWQLKADITATQNTAGNYSDVTMKVYLVADSTWNINASAMSGTTNINGSSAGFSANPTTGGGATIPLTTRTVRVAHNSDGTKTFAFSFSYTLNITSGHLGGTVGTLSGSGTMSLTKIPRAYDYTVSTAKANVGDTITITVKDNGSGFDPWLYFYYGSLNWSVGKIPVGTYKFKLDTAKLAPIYPNAASSWGRIEVQTWQGNSTKIGGYPTRLDLTLPESLAKPTVDSVAPKETNAAVTAVIGNATSYVQDNSLVQFTTKATAQYGATFVTSQILYNGQVLPNVNGIPTLDLSKVHVDAGEITLKASVTDSRGFSATKDFKISVLAYATPTINALNAARNTKDMTEIDVVKTGTVSSLKIGDAEKNPYSAVTEYRLVNTEAWTTAKKETNAFANVAIPKTDIKKSYEIRVTLTDKFTSSVAVVTVSTAQYPLSFYRDIGVGVGKLYEPGHGSLDVANDIYIGGKLVSPSGPLPIPSGIDAAIVPKVISKDTDLNSLTTAGEYSCSTDAIAATLKNVPEKFAFHLKVVVVGGPQQFLSTYHPDTGCTYVRKMYNNKWGAWLRTSNLNRQASLWTGNLYMRETDIITPMKSLSQCANGWCLIWQRWNGTALVNSSVTYSYVPKYAVTSGNWGFYHFAAPDNAMTQALIPKYLYVQENGTKLQGYKDNATAANQFAVLVAIVEW